MPRVNKIYELPPGSYGISGETVKSAPYNTVLDDLRNDNNDARPITSGGTGATSAAAARTALGTDDASNLTKGTLANARLPASPTFTGTVSANSFASTTNISVGAATVYTNGNIGGGLWGTDLKAYLDAGFATKANLSGAAFTGAVSSTGSITGNNLYAATNVYAGGGTGTLFPNGNIGGASWTGGDLVSHLALYAKLAGPTFTGTVSAGSFSSTSNIAVGAATYATTGNINGSAWGGDLSSYLPANYARLIGATFTGAISAPSASFAGTMTANTITTTTSISVGAATFYTNGNVGGTIWGSDLKTYIDGFAKLSGAAFAGAVSATSFSTAGTVTATGTVTAGGNLRAGGGTAILYTNGNVGGGTWGTDLKAYLDAKFDFPWNTVGTIILAQAQTAVSAGSTIAGSNLRASTAAGAGSGGGASMSGTWRNLSGDCPGNTSASPSSVSLFLRIS